MNALTQVWVFSIALCSVILVTTFKVAGRLGLFIGFCTSLILIYLLLHKGLKLFLTQIKAELHKGSDPTGINALILKHKSKYPIAHCFLHYTDAISHPLVWRNFQNDLHIVLNKNMVQRLDVQEKNILVHLMLSHGSKHSKLRRRFLSIIYLSFSPVSRALSPAFNLFSSAVSLKKQIFKADLMALKLSESTSLEKINDFSLFLRKLHNLKFHKTIYTNGEHYFSILSTSKSGAFNLKISPSLDARLKNLIGGSTHETEISTH